MPNKITDTFRRVLRWRPGTDRPRDTVGYDDVGVTRTLSDGSVEHVRWDALSSVVVMTTDDGPFADDVFWLLIGEGEGSGCAVPSQADGASALVHRLGELPGFDHRAMIEAMGCCTSATFLCWRRSG